MHTFGYMSLCMGMYGWFECDIRVTGCGNGRKWEVSMNGSVVDIFIFNAIFHTYNYPYLCMCVQASA